MRFSEAEFKLFLRNSSCKIREEPSKSAQKPKKKRQISKLEELVHWEFLRDPNIEILETQPGFVVMPAFFRNGRNYQAIKYTADFRILEDGKEWIVEVKSRGVYEANKKNYPMVRKLFLKFYPELSFREIIFDDAGTRKVKEY